MRKPYFYSNKWELCQLRITNVDWYKVGIWLQSLDTLFSSTLSYTIEYDRYRSDCTRYVEITFKQIFDIGDMQKILEKDFKLFMKDYNTWKKWRKRKERNGRI